MLLGVQLLVAGRCRVRGSGHRRPDGVPPVRAVFAFRSRGPCPCHRGNGARVTTQAFDGRADVPAHDRSSFSGRNYVSGMLSRTTRSLSVGLGRRLGDVGLTFAQYLILVRLWRAAPAPLVQADLVVDLAVERSSMSTQLVLLDRIGLVERTTDPSDGRRLLVRLTDKGALLETAVLEIVERYEAQLVEGVPVTERRAMWDALEHLQQRATALRGSTAALDRRPRDGEEA